MTLCSCFTVFCFFIVSTLLLFHCFNIVTILLFLYCFSFMFHIVCSISYVCTALCPSCGCLKCFISWVELSIFLFMKYIVRLGFSLGPLGHYCNTTGLKLMLALLLGNILKTSILMKCSWWLSFSQRSSNTDTLGWPMEWEDQSP